METHPNAGSRDGFCPRPRLGSSGAGETKKIVADSGASFLRTRPYAGCTESPESQFLVDQLPGQVDQ